VPRPESPSADLRFLDSLIRMRSDRRRSIRLRRWRPENPERLPTTLLEIFSANIRKSRKSARIIRDITLETRRRFRTPFFAATANRIQGVISHLDGHPRKARRLLTEAARTFEKNHFHIEAGDTWRILIDVLMYTGDDLEAQRAARRAKKLYALVDRIDARRLGSLEMNIGNIHHRRDRFKEALESYARARSYYSKIAAKDWVAVADFNRANVLTCMERTREARKLYERTSKDFLDQGMISSANQSLFALAEVDKLEGLLDPALARFRDVHERYKSDHDAIGMAYTANETAGVLLGLNRPAEAYRFAVSACRPFRKGGHDNELCASLSLAAGALVQMGRPGRAVPLLRRAVEIQSHAGNPLAKADYEAELARALLAKGDAAAAMKSVRRPLALFRRRKLKYREGKALVTAAMAALGLHKERIAAHRAERALTLARQRRDHGTQISALLILADLDERSSYSGRAYRRLLSAERCVEFLRGGISSEESKLAFAIDKSSVYEKLVLNRLRRGTPDAVEQALLYAERGKARALLERLQSSSSQPAAMVNEKTRTLLERLSELDRRLSMARSKVVSQTRATGVKGLRLGRVDQILEERTRILHRLTAKDSAAGIAAGAFPPSPAQCRKLLGPDDLVLEYVSAGGWIHLFRIDRDHVSAFPELIRVEDLETQLTSLRFLLSKGTLGKKHNERFAEYIESALHRRLKSLGEILLAPAMERLDGAANVRIVPHGPLHGLPFHALELDGRPLIDRAAVSYLPSLATIAALSTSDGEILSAVPLIVGAPDAAAPRISEEVEVIRGRLGAAEIIRHRSTTLRTLLMHGIKRELLHVACHGVYCGGSGELAGLKLGETWISTSELRQIPRAASLVVLSGCQTGLGSVHSGDEWVGIVRCFLQAGSRAVVASLWEVFDDSTTELMVDFYGFLRSGDTLASAMARAQRRARERHSSPMHWAPFAVMGHPDWKLPMEKIA